MGLTVWCLPPKITTQRRKEGRRTLRLGAGRVLPEIVNKIAPFVFFFFLEEENGGNVEIFRKAQNNRFQRWVVK